MENYRPKTIEEYIEWLKKCHKSEISEVTRNHYESVAIKVRSEFKKSKLWVQLLAEVKEFNTEYLTSTGYHLIVLPYEPELDIKPYNSFLLKSFRKNILENSRWPEEPEGSWILPSNWFTKISDIVRTMFVVKYLDGVEFLATKISSVCSKSDCDCNISYEAREEGYYAVHLNVQHQFEIPKLTWDTEKVDMVIEIQITTQLQEVIRKLLHKYYEERRQEAKEPYIKWQWDYKSDEFSTNYLGHILHYVEGMIVDIRERQKGKESYEERIREISK